MTNILVICDLVRSRKEEFDNGQTVVYYNKMKPWQVGKGYLIDYLVLCGYTWKDLDQEIKYCLAPCIRNTRLTPDMGPWLIEI